MKPRTKYLVVVAGATAAGKTDVAIALARHFGTVVVSADSRQFYREMNIGTAKPRADQLSLVTHYMVNNKSVHELYGAGDYADDASRLLEELFERHDVVVLAGGSGLYIDALLYGVDEFEKVSPALREELSALYREKGLAWLQEELRKADPAYLLSADVNNPQRLLRALEVSLHTGKPFSGYRKGQKADREFVPLKIMINPERDQLYERINRRTGEMMSAGLLEEARSLYPLKHLNALKTVGYKELFDHFEGKTTHDEAVDKIRQHTRNYAKRQLTWFRNRDSFKEFPPEDIQRIISFLEKEIQ